ncbi:MAG: four helix bundle protein [Bacteroidales bacterium]|nr:four helix bundle protein [Bacteroidales bacterium]
MEDNVIKRKSRDFAIDIIRTYQWLCEEKHEFVMSKQILRSGTSVGANVAEGVRGQSKADFFAKMNIALKEASETSFWLDILHATDYLPDEQFYDLNNKCEEILSILVAILKNR